MILNSGIFLIIWTTFKWKVLHVIWDDRRNRLYARILGSYTIILAVLSYFFKVGIPMVFFIVDFICFLLMDICFVIIKIKKARKEMIRNVQLGMCLLLLLCPVYIICLDVNEIASGIIGLCGVMMLLCTPFEEIPFFEEKHKDSK